MAKIVTITNPLTGQPAQVDQLDHTAQQIDDGLNIARGVSNPWINDNGVFLPGCLVDQRGGHVVPPGVPSYVDSALTQSAGDTTGYRPVVAMTSTYDAYIGSDGATYYCAPGNAVRGYTGKGDTIDRWMNENDKVVSTLENGLLNLTYNGTSTFMQKFQMSDCGQMTASVLVHDISGELILLIQSIETWEQFTFLKLHAGLNNVTFTSKNCLCRFAIFSENSGPKTISLVAAKLELGSQQTLAHQDENGNWVLNEIPDYGEQLRRCQRYFQLYSSADLRPAKAVDCRPTMRADPSQSTIVVNSTTYYYNTADL